MPVLGIIASQISGHLFSPTGAYDSIATASGASATFDFTSIPATYTHLELRCILKDSRTGFNDSEQYMRFNNDSGSNYAIHRLLGNGSSAVSEAGTSASSIAIHDSSSVQTSVFAATVIQILDYASTSKYKTVRILNGYDFNGSGNIEFQSGLWMSTSAINRITFTPLTANYNSNAQIALYGIKGA
jgi:hypothetical protein